MTNQQTDIHMRPYREVTLPIEYLRKTKNEEIKDTNQSRKKTGRNNNRDMEYIIFSYRTLN